MIIPEQYQCDKCGLTSFQSSSVWTLRIDAKEAVGYEVPIQLEGNFYLMVCLACAESMGIKRKPTSQEEEQIQPPTVEDLIRQIIEMVGGRS
ncbi:MAG: hypothetical protein R3B95_11780 [Nitrospirales bacterium]|nr:hypothetical protein [Nitrospirales bacterium]